MTREEMRKHFDEYINRNNRLFFKTGNQQYLAACFEIISLAKEFGFTVKEDCITDTYTVL